NSHFRLLSALPTRRSSDLATAVDVILQGIARQHTSATDRCYLAVVGIRNAEPSVELDALARTLHVLLTIDLHRLPGVVLLDREQDRKSTRLNSSHVKISYA